MVLQTSYSGRVQPTEFGRLLSPAACVLCGRIGRTNDEIFANLGIELELYGCLYLCTGCCEEIARFVEYHHSDEVNALKHLCEVNLAWVKREQAENTRLRKLVDVFINTGSIDGSSVDGDSSLHVSEAESDSDYINSILNGD